MTKNKDQNPILTGRGDRRALAVLHAKRYTDHDEQLAFWASLACALLLTHNFSDAEFQAAAQMAHETARAVNLPTAG